jgi:hypothetical protein
MAVTVTNQSNPLGSKVVQDTDTTSTAADNTTGGSGSLYAVEIDNSGNGSAVYFKLADSTNATGGTTAADVVLMCPGSSKKNYVFLGGIAFSNGFSHWCVTAAAEASVADPLNDVIVRYVTD